MGLCGLICVLSPATSSQTSLVTGALTGYAAGFVVVFVWTRRLHRRHGAAEPARSALPAALMGGATGGLFTLLRATAEQL